MNTPVTAGSGVIATDLLAGVLRLHSAGLATIPIKADGSKEPAVSSWKQYEKRLPTEGELQKWFGNGKRQGLALIGGKVSGNLEILDFDAPELIAGWRDLVEDVAPGLLDRLPQVETPAGGLHVFYRCAEIAGNKKLAEREIEVPEGTKGARQREGLWFKVETTIETRGEGGYVITAGSPAACHPSGKPYKLIKGDLKAIPEITQRERAVLLACARSFNAHMKTAPEAKREGSKSSSSGPRPGDDFNQRGDVRALLDKHGWKYLRPGPCGELWQRPGGDHTSATLFPDGSLYVFSSNAHPFDHDRRYDRFSIYTILEHGGDWKAAAKALAEQGFGETKKAKSAGKTKTGATVEPATGAGVVAHALVLKRILDSLEQCDFHQLGGLQPKAEIPQKYYLVLCIRQLLEIVKGQNFALARKNDFIFVYNGQYWREVDRDKLKDFLGEAAERLGVWDLEAQRYEFKDKLYKQFLSAASFDEVEVDVNKVLINLQNGTFEITAASHGLRDFRAEDFLRHQLPFEYDEKATASLFEEYLNRVLPDVEVQNIIAEFFGYVFTRNLKLEKALLLYGSGANGKSVLFDVMNALLGRENTTNYSLSDLMEEHNRAQIANKLLNYGSEMNASVAKDVFKNLVSGEPIMARLKYSNSFLMENYAKLSFNCNELPKDIEQSEAYFRRLLIAQFRVTIPEDEQDAELAQKIIATELSGVFNWVLGGLRRLLKQRRFSKCQDADAALKAYRAESDSVAMFVDEERWQPVQTKEEGYESLKSLYVGYRSFCSECGYKPLGRNNFSKRLESNGFTVERLKDGRIVPMRKR